MLARQTGVVLAAGDTVRRVFRWLALRGSPPGNRDLPDMRLRKASLFPGAVFA
jgi:hypothetical protein